MKDFNTFTNLYPVSKTLRFELIPQGRTLDHIRNKGFLKKDEHRSESYLKVKKIIDEYHKSFISKALDGLVLEGLDEYYDYYSIQNRSPEQKKGLQEIQASMRKQISEAFKSRKDYKSLFSKELIKVLLKEFARSEEELELIREFDNFTTYFTGFHENRKNMYSAEEQSTAVAYRLIHENLPRFLDNIRSFAKISQSSIAGRFAHMAADDQLGPVIQVERVEEFFQLKFFNETLTQQGIDRYNHLLGGWFASEGAEKIQGLNEYINLHNQTSKREDRLPRLKILYKQILSDRNSASFIPDQFSSDEELLTAVEQFYQEISEQVMHSAVVKGQSIGSLLKQLDLYDLAGIYLRNDQGLRDISRKVFDDWSIIQKAITNWYNAHYEGRAKKGTERFEKERDLFFKSADSFSIQFLLDCLKEMNSSYPVLLKQYLQTIEASEIGGGIIDLIQSKYEDIKELLNSPYPADQNLAQDKRNVGRIKDLLDSLKELEWFIKPLLGKGDEAFKDERFYGELMPLWNTISPLTSIYNKVRSYLTRKPYSTEKMKLNFENSTLLNGWDVNKEPDNTGLIFRKNGLYYLGILDSSHRRAFAGSVPASDGASYEKMEYKLLPGPNKMLPKVFFAKSRITDFAPSDQLLERYRAGTHKKGSGFSLKDCHALIDFFKASISKHEDWKNFGFRFSNTSSYTDISGFYREVESQGYKITFRDIPDSYVDKLVDEGGLYLFQIYNKDFSPHSKGTPNLHTIYWKMAFSPENLADVVYKLNGEAEVFYRKASIRETEQVVHQANTPIANKNKLNPKKQSEFSYAIVKDRRYSKDKFQFHVPITMNFKAGGPSRINSLVNSFLSGNPDVKIIGIDRGERHLLYLTMIDQSGKILCQYSLNEIVNEYRGLTYRTNYHDLLDAKEGNRDEARRNWKTIETIKELKEGYLSQVINKITQLILDNQAIVVLEDLNIGFKRGRQKVEKQVYQKFEKMLIDKLNYLVKKDASNHTLGGALKACQLTNQFESFKKMGKQNGFLFYVPAWNTSKMDPVTGFVNLFDLRYESVEKSQLFFQKFRIIRFNQDRKYFEFDFDYSAFTSKAEGSRTGWTICSYGSRIETYKNDEKNNQWDHREVSLTDQFKGLFSKYGIDYHQNSDLTDPVCSQGDKDFFVRLLKLIQLTLQMRNSIPGTQIDYLISPVSNRSGEFFDSRNAQENHPQNADANGAYNIARKGLWILEQIRQAEETDRPNLSISNKEWLAFAQKHAE